MQVVIPPLGILIMIIAVILVVNYGFGAIAKWIAASLIILVLYLLRYFFLVGSRFPEPDKVLICCFEHFLPAGFRTTKPRIYGL
jgi:hypothetical protein